MTRQRDNLLPKGIWIVFAGYCLFGIAVGVLGGTDNLSDIVFGIALFGTPVLFTIWAVINLDPQKIGDITGHERWRQGQQQRGQRGNGSADSDDTSGQN
jgi:hypothetical protein